MFQRKERNDKARPRRITPRCPKCGENNTAVVAVTFDDDKLRCNCHRCSYQWNELTLETRLKKEALKKEAEEILAKVKAKVDDVDDSSEEDGDVSDESDE